MIKLCSRCFERFLPFYAVYILKRNTRCAHRLCTKIALDICLAQSMTNVTKFFVVTLDICMIIVSREINHCHHKGHTQNNVTFIYINHTRRSIFYLRCMLFTSWSFFVTFLRSWSEKTVERREERNLSRVNKCTPAILSRNTTIRKIWDFALSLFCY